MNNPKVIIVGKPNVGKSTLFNKLCKKRLAIVHDRPGVTRDIKKFKATLAKMSFTLVDTAGIEASKDELNKAVLHKTKSELESADLLLFMVDGRRGIDASDREIAQHIRKLGKKIILVANKYEGGTIVDDSELYRFGFGDPVKISSEHNIGFFELAERISAVMDDQPEETTEEAAPGEEFLSLKLAIIGRPNVGKSSIFNRILNAERSVVSDVSGTTRDAISEFFDVDGRLVEIIDTAGMRRKSKVIDSVETLSVTESINAIRRSHIIVFAVDAEQSLEKQDLSILSLAVQEGKGVVLVVNKSDLIEDMKEYKIALNDYIERFFFDIKGLPVLYVSAKENSNIKSILKKATYIEKNWNLEIKTSALNSWLKYATESNIPPIASNGRRARIKYITQTATRPPTFALFCNIPSAIPESYIRYLANSMRENFKLDGVPIRLRTRKMDNPYAPAKDYD